MSKFKELSFGERLNLSEKILLEHSEKIPVILESHNHKIDLHKTKYIIPRELTVGQFLLDFKKNLSISSEETIFIFCKDNVLIPTGYTFGTIYNKYKDKDGFLYLLITKENTFGLF